LPLVPLERGDDAVFHDAECSMVIVPGRFTADGKAHVNGKSPTW
jgi:hypothetical protein